MTFVGFLLIGLIAGGLAGRITEGRGFGCLGNIVVGVIGALLGGWLLPQIGIAVPGGVIGALVVSTLGAILFLTVLNLIRR